MATTTKSPRTTGNRRLNSASGGVSGLLAAGDRLPSGSRRYGQWAATVLFVLLVVLAAGWLWSQKGDQVQVLEVTRDLPAGTTLTDKDVRAVTVSGVPAAVPLSKGDTVFGKTLKVGLTPGQLVTVDVVTSAPVPASGERLVGLLLEPGRLPAGLGPGDVVTILEGPANTESASVPTKMLTGAQVLADKVTVHRSSKSAGGGTLLTVVVPQSSANTVAQFGAAGRVVVVQSPMGE